MENAEQLRDMNTHTNFNVDDGTQNATSNTTETPPEFAHIKGWGVDADPKNDPTYPMKRYNGDDHKRSHYKKPKQQTPTVEILKTIERKDLSATFGTTSPPSGLSGAIRRFAFKFSENNYLHWLPLIFADRVNAVEGIVDDLKHGHIPNIIAERGYRAEWKYNRKALIEKMAVAALITTCAIMLLSGKGKKAKKRLI